MIKRLSRLKNVSIKKEPYSWDISNNDFLNLEINDLLSAS